jgi:aromatic ring-cleaving dioxygenase
VTGNGDGGLHPRFLELKRLAPRLKRELPAMREFLDVKRALMRLSAIGRLDLQSSHVHVYDRPETREAAAARRRELEARFATRLGRWYDALAGPHTRSMHQVVFAPAEFARLVPWVMLNRGPLDVLVHPSTGDDLADQTAHALWLGERLPLDLAALTGH